MKKTRNNVLVFKRPAHTHTGEPIMEAAEKLLVEFQRRLRELRENYNGKNN